ncbi:MAG: Stf0 family sulfotransferase [Sedimentitalea sp.]
MFGVRAIRSFRDWPQEFCLEPTKAKRPKSYVICTSPRSGSTLLCRLLIDTGRCGQPSSLFHRADIAQWRLALGVAKAEFTDRRAELMALFRAAHCQGTGATGIFGVRLQRHSFAFFAKQLAHLHPDQTSDRDRIIAQFGPTLFIHLTRANKVDQAISLVKANQTGLWHQSADGRELERLAPPREPVYDAAQISKSLAQVRAYDLDWCKWFDAQGIAPMRVEYDDLSGDPQTVVASILQKLGQDPALARDVVPSVAKLRDAKSQEWADKFAKQARDCDL